MTDPVKAKRDADFDKARETYKEATRLLMSAGIDPACIVPSMAAAMTDAIATLIRPDGIGGLVDMMTETIKRQSKQRSALLAEAFPGGVEVN